MTHNSDSQRWARIESILDRALELSGTERESYLAEACSGDAGLRREVEDLLRSAEASGPLDHVLGEVVGGVADEAASSLGANGAAIQRRVGPWRILDVIGSGGMGRVFLAERVEGGFEQRVALKILRWEMASPLLIDRFQNEQQILASLEHPSIARLIDGGITEDGLPYLAMEYVEGEPIDAACRRNASGLRARLDLFLQVANVVDFAHRNLVVHRDLKPSNILVDTAGRVRLLDFGVARIVQEPGTGGELTQTQLAPATPSWAAPEQLSGGAITTGTDVWALGVLLYRLLTDEHPFDTSGGVQSVTERILTQDPVPPSQRIQGERGRRLQGDLDNIVAKALEKDPQRRYGSVARLVDDLERYDRGQPVSAHAPTWGYRAGKAVMRHRRAIAIASMALITFAGLIGFYTWRLVVERDRALAEQKKTEQVTQFVQSLFESNDPTQTQGEDITARQMLDRGSERIESELDEQPEIAGELHQTVGQLYTSLGSYPEARFHLTRAVELRTEGLGDDAVPVAESLDRLANVMMEQDDLDAAVEVLRDALRIRRQHPEDGRGLSSTLNELGLTLAYRGDYEEAQALLEESYELKKATLGEVNRQTATTLMNLGLAIKWKGDLDRAEEIYRRVLEIRKVDPGELTPDYAISLDNLGVLLGQRGQYEESERCFRQALRIRRQLLGDEHPDVAMNLNNLATLYRVQGRLDEAEPIYRQVLDLNRRIHGPEHRTVATNLHNLGSLQASQGHYAAAESSLTAALAIRGEALGPDHIEVALAQNNLVSVLLQQGTLDRADEYSRQSVAIARAAVGSESPQLANTLAGRGRVLLALGRPSDAQPVLAEALRIQQGVLEPDHWETAASRALLGECLMALDDPQSEAVLVEGYEGLLAGRGPDFAATRRAQTALHEHFLRSGQLERAKEFEAEGELR